MNSTPVPPVTSRRPPRFPVRKISDRGGRVGDTRPVSVVTTGVSIERQLVRNIARVSESTDTELETPRGVRGKGNVGDKSVTLLGALETWDKKNDQARQIVNEKGLSDLSLSDFDDLTYWQF